VPTRSRCARVATGAAVILSAVFLAGLIVALGIL
jgi:hypothetical protein